MQAFCDFDGTISVQDATDFILSRFADREWQDIEEQWKQGAVGWLSESC
jgi:2-hydroxy-3-keto-5-methylthiopentenyl-1-phosphate phosphatase